MLFQINLELEPFLAGCRNVVRDFISLFFPQLCLACQGKLPMKEGIFCVSCQFKLPYTNFHHELENPCTERFWGRVELEAGASLFQYLKGGRVQTLIKQLKYEGRKELAFELGVIYGRRLSESPLFNSIDCIVPVPLHPRKERIRSYNQSAYFGMGLASILGVVCYPKAMERSIFTMTQTRKSRQDRFENVLQAFKVKDEEYLRGKHILLVDDVITTGATLEACAIKLKALPGVTVSVATIALAEI